MTVPGAAQEKDAACVSRALGDRDNGATCCSKVPHCTTRRVPPATTNSCETFSRLLAPCKGRKEPALSDAGSPDRGPAQLGRETRRQGIQVHPYRQLLLRLGPPRKSFAA